MTHLTAPRPLPPLSEDTAVERMTLEALRHEIDEIDRALLDLLERRLALADRVGRAKGAPTGPHLKLRPDREAGILQRLIDRAGPLSRPAVLPIWREVVGAGLARQGRLKVVIWPGREPAGKIDAARRRFGSQADYLTVTTPEAALDQAEAEDAVAILALDDEAPWWISLAEARPDLWVFEALDGRRGPNDPQALAVGRIDPQALAPGRVIGLSRGGEAGEGPARRRSLRTHHGWSLSLMDGHAGPLDRALGVIGRAPGFCLAEPSRGRD